MQVNQPYLFCPCCKSSIFKVGTLNYRDAPLFFQCLNCGFQGEEEEFTWLYDVPYLKEEENS